MAHFAEINPTTNEVLRVLVGDNNDPDQGYGWLIANLGGTWLQCSYNTHAGVHNAGGTPFRLNYPGTGWYYHPDINGFCPPQPYPSWTLNTTTGLYDPPTPYPSDGQQYVWDEVAQAWLFSV